MDFLDTTLIGYTRLGYARRIARLGSPLPRIDGRHVVITGATAGLGEATARKLASLGATLTLVGRNEAKLAKTRATIMETTGAEVLTERADLSLMREVRALAERLLATNTPIHVLVNNAGVLSNERVETDEGLELTFATNLLAPYVLTELLVPRLVASAPSRVVNVSSGGMYTQKIRVDDFETKHGTYDGPSAYARTKRGEVILTELWAEELRGRGVTVHAMHPGWASTDAVRTSLPTFHRVLGPWLRTPDEGADTIAWLAAANEPAETTGLFFHDREPRPTHRFAWTREDENDRTTLRRELARIAARTLGRATR